MPETAVIGYPHDIKGEGAFAFIVLKDNTGDTDAVVKELKSAVATKIAKYAVPDQILVVKRLPKTRSGKVMRRLLRKIITGRTQDLGHHHPGGPQCHHRNPECLPEIQRQASFLSVRSSGQDPVSTPLTECSSQICLFPAISEAVLSRA